MEFRMKIFVNKVIEILVLILFPFTLISTLWLKVASRYKLKVNAFIYNLLGVLPIKDHYYQPMINAKKHLRYSLRDERFLPGINFNDHEQLNILNNFNFNNELIEFPLEKGAEEEYYYNCKAFCSGDSEYLYNMIRYFQPKNLYEIGSGFSTLMARNAIEKNKEVLDDYSCNHVCIEPYEMPWLNKLDIEIMKDKVETIDHSFFKSLKKNDILFIDSSHIIRPQGDVLFELLEILPILNSGVIIHIHDIFSPYDYLDDWVHNHYLWNEQYILEAFLSCNDSFRIIGATNFLSHKYKNEFSAKCPIYKSQTGREPGSFWIQKN